VAPVKGAGSAPVLVPSHEKPKASAAPAAVANPVVPPGWGQSPGGADWNTARRPGAARPALAAVRAPIAKPIEEQVTDALQTVKPQVDAALTQAIAGSKLEQRAMVVKPSDVLRQVQSADINVRLPIKAGESLSGPLGIKMAKVLENTTVSLQLKAQDGNLDLKNAKVTFDPPLDGPLWTEVPKLSVQNGKVTVQINGFPDINVGPKLPSDMNGLANALEELTASRSVTAGVLGADLIKVKVPSELKVRGPTTGDALGSLGHFVDGARSGESVLSLKNVTMAGGKIGLGEGAIELEKGSKVEMSGSLKDLKLSGTVAFKNLALKQDGVEVKGGRGSTQLQVRFEHSNGQGTVSTKLDNLNLQVESVITKRKNGDGLELGQGMLKNGSIEMKTAVSGSGLIPTKAGASTLEHLSLERFQGTIKGAQITIPDGKDTAQVRVEMAMMNGTLKVDANRILLDGELSNLKGEVLDFQGGAPGVELDLKRIGLTGGGAVKIDTDAGLSMTGNVRVDAEIAHAKLGVKGGPSTELAAGSKMGINAHSVEVSRQAFKATGSADVDLKLQNLAVGAAGVKLQASQAAVKGKVGEATLDSTQGVTLAKTGKMTMNATLSGGQISLGNGLKVELAAGTQMQTALTRAAFGNGRVEAEFAKGTKLDAVLESGSMAVKGPNGKPVALTLGQGTTAHFEFDQLAYDSKGIPIAKGRMELNAGLSARNLDLGAIEQLTQTQLDPAQKLSAKLKVQSDFTIREDKTFELDKLRFAIESEIGKVSGRLE
jgi:hypothetical protein